MTVRWFEVTIVGFRAQPHQKSTAQRGLPIAR
jgi:hypothetical protein